MLDNLPLITPFQCTDSYSALHLYPIKIDLTKVNKSRSEIFEELRDGGIGVNLHYIPIHTQPYFQRFGFNLGDFPNAERYYSRTISIPLYSSMTIKQQDKVIFELKRVLQ